MNENVNVCITPKGDKPVLHFSQFDNERVFTVTVLADDGESSVDLTDLDIEFRIRKTDSHVVTIAPISVLTNVITFMTTEQLCACCGQNIASVVLMKDDTIISTLDILVDIQRDILSGGLTSESDIRNLTTQIETIIPEVLADDYYTKTEVDDLIDDIPTFDPTNYYDKSDVNGLLADKADAADVYTKGETDTLLFDKADKSDVYTKAQTDSLLFFKADKINEKTADNLPAASVSFTDAGGDCPLSVMTVEASSGKYGTYISRSDSQNVSFFEGLLNGTYGFVDLGTLSWSYITSGAVPRFQAALSPAGSGSADNTQIATAICSLYPVASWANVTNLSSYDKSIAEVSGGGYLAVQNTDYTDATLFTNAMNGVYLIYELATPATPTITQDQIDTLIKAFNNTLSCVIFGQTLSQSGVLDVISGLLTLEDDSTIQCEGQEIDTLQGANTISNTSGDILTLKYFGFNAEDLFRYIRLIKG